MHELPLSPLQQAMLVSTLAQPETGLDVIHLGYEVAYRHIVTLRGHGSLPPLFLVHGGDGHALVFREIVPLLAHERPCYAFDADAFDTNLRMEVKAIAATYVAELQRLQPSGPVHLAAFCLGGLISIEMAALLRDAGREVGFLGLINTYVPGLPRQRSLPARLAVGLREGHLRDQLRLALATRLGMSQPEVETPLALLLNHAADTYQPGPIPERVHLFRGTDNPRLYEPEDLGWGMYCRGELVLHPRLPAFHTKMLSGQDVVALAKQLESVLPQSAPHIESK